jgi:hypothetical protein
VATDAAAEEDEEVEGAPAVGVGTGSVPVACASVTPPGSGSPFVVTTASPWGWTTEPRATWAMSGATGWAAGPGLA